MKNLICLMGFLFCLNVASDNFEISKNKLTKKWSKKIILSFNFIDKSQVLFVKESKKKETDTLLFSEATVGGMDGVSVVKGNLKAKSISYSISTKGFQDKSLILKISINDGVQIFDDDIYINLNTKSGCINFTENITLQYSIVNRRPL